MTESAGTCDPQSESDDPFDPRTDVPKLRDRYNAIRAQSERLCDPLETEDYVVQSMPDVSPTRWHLAHTTWFFETFLLKELDPGYQVFHPQFEYLFNSYYNTVGPQYPRPRRGLLSRPTVKEILDYRRHVDHHMRQLLANLDTNRAVKLAGAIDIGLHHEQQHQELMLTDIKHVFARNPLQPVYRPRSIQTVDPLSAQWRAFAEGLHHMGHTGPSFCYDNETPQHRVFVPAFELASRLVTNDEYLAFIQAGGYAQPEHWLSEGWATVQTEGWSAPLYWEQRDGTWWQFTLSGLRSLEPGEPVCHLSYFEADAYARWAGARLPTEAEWELSATDLSITGNFVERETYHPIPLAHDDSAGSHQIFGDVWEWTASPYAAYPGYRPAAGALGEYNGKFMCNQFVLRGGSCATPCTHIRPTYRNFFPPAARWQFTGLRLAR